MADFGSAEAREGAFGIWEELPKGFLALAPMEGVTDVAFRQVIATAGRPDLFFTEFTNVSSYASERGRANALERLEIAPTDAPIIAQIWGSRAEHFAELAAELESLGFAGLDINMGCPDRHVNAAGGGAAMIRTPELAVECLRRARAATRLPVSVKTRLGYTHVLEFREWLPVLLAEKPAALTVHLRTRKEMSKVAAHFELIPEIVELCRGLSPKTKLIINGDIKDLKHARTLSAQYPEVDGWMIGRGVFENPYCFTEHEATREDLMGLLRLHLDLYEAAGERILAQRKDALRRELEARNYQGSIEARLEEVRGLSFEPLKHYFKIYVREFEGAGELRSRLMECRSVMETKTVLSDMVA